MQHYIFPDLGQIERIRMLEDNSDDVVEQFTYDRVLTDEEKQEEQELFSAVHIELARMEAEKKQLVERLNADIKVKRTIAEKTLLKIKNGREEVTETVYVIHDEDEQKVGTYNYRGELISERPMRSGERQRRMRFPNFSDEKVTVTTEIDGKRKVI